MSLLEPWLDAAASSADYNVYRLRQPRSGSVSSDPAAAVYPPLYLPQRYSEPSFTALGRDARSLLFSAYDSVTCDYVVVELIRTVDAVGGAWLLENRDLVVLLLRARLGGLCHPTLVRTLDLWTPAADIGELRSFAVAYECGGQQLGYYLAPYVLLGHAMSHWRLSNMLYQLVWAVHRVHVGCGSGRIRFCRPWDVPITCFLYDEDSCALKLDVRLLVTTATAAAASAATESTTKRHRGRNRTAACSGRCTDSIDSTRQPSAAASLAVAGVGRMLVRHMAAAAFGTLDVGALALSAPEALLDRLLRDVLRFTCGAGAVGCGHEPLFEHWAATTAAAGLESPNCQLTLLREFLLMLLREAATAENRKSYGGEKPAVCAGSGDAFERVLGHPYVSVWHEEGDLDCGEDDADIGDGLATDLELLVQRSSSRSSSVGESSTTGISDELLDRGMAKIAVDDDADTRATVSPVDYEPTATAESAAALGEAAAASEQELPLHALVTIEGRYIMFREIKRFELSHPHRIRPLGELCIDSMALGGRSTGQPLLWEARAQLLPPQLASRLRDAIRRFYPAK